MRRRPLIAAASALILVFALAAVAFAHAELVGSEPAAGSVVPTAPKTVQLLFSEPIEIEFFNAQVYAANRTRVDQGAARLSPDDARVVTIDLKSIDAGTYTVIWRALSLDGHVVRGSFAFGVGAGAQPSVLDFSNAATGAPFPLEAGARWLLYLSTFVLVGGFAFWWLGLRPALAVAEPDGPGIESRAARRWLRVAWGALAVLFLVNFAALLLQAANAAGVPVGEVLTGRAVSRLLVATRYGVLWIVRFGLVLGIVGVLAWISVARASATRAAWIVGFGLSGLILLTISGSGHASAEPAWLPAVLADWAHILAGGVWIGGLVQLALVVPVIVRMVDPARRRHVLGALVPRFSVIAIWSVAIIVLTGFYGSLLHIPSWNALLDTAYGAALSGKLIVFAPLLALGALNLLVLTPRFRRVVERPKSTESETGDTQWLRRLIIGEIGLAVIVLGVTGILTGLPPASSSAPVGKPITEEQHTASYAITLGVNPNQAGENEVSIHVADHSDNNIDGARVDVALSMIDMEMGTREVQAEPAGSGEYRIKGNQLSMAGNWQADITVSGTGAAETAQFNWTVGQSPGVDQPTLSPGRILILALNLPSAAAILALAAAAGLLIEARHARRARARREAKIGGLALLVVGMLIGTTSIANAYLRSLPNPVPADAASLARGQELYQANCAACHGVSGRGDGPAGLALRPRPADFRVHLAEGHTDRELFGWITNGIDGTAMPAFGDELTEQERWDLVNYLHTFAPGG